MRKPGIQFITVTALAGSSVEPKVRHAQRVWLVNGFLESVAKPYVGVLVLFVIVRLRVKTRKENMFTHVSVEIKLECINYRY